MLTASTIILRPDRADDLVRILRVYVEVWEWNRKTSEFYDAGKVIWWNDFCLLFICHQPIPCFALSYPLTACHDEDDISEDV
jgi:hypothetical protein